MADVSGTKALVRRHGLNLANSARLDVEYETKIASPEDTGELVNSVEAYDALDSGGTIIVTLEARADHAIFVIAGTDPHVITPTKSHGLLVWQSGGTTVFHRGPVNHPGTQANTNFWSDQVLQERWTRALQDATRSVITT